MNWLGRLDSNQGMPVPKTGALPLGYAPTICERNSAAVDRFIAIDSVIGNSKKEIFHFINRCLLIERILSTDF